MFIVVLAHLGINHLPFCFLFSVFYPILFVYTDYLRILICCYDVMIYCDMLLLLCVAVVLRRSCSAESTGADASAGAAAYIADIAASDAVWHARFGATGSAACFFGVLAAAPVDEV